MNRILFALYFLLSCLPSFSSEISINPNIEQLPSEIILLTRNISAQDKIKIYAELLNSNLKKLTQNDLLILTKSIIYPHILEIKFEEFEDYPKISTGLKNQFLKKYKDTQELVGPFTKYLLDDFSRELDLILKRKDFSKLFSENQKETYDLKKTRRIAKIITPWFHAFLSMSPEDFDMRLQNSYIELFSKLSKITETYTKLKSPIASNSHIVYFDIIKNIVIDKEQDKTIIEENNIAEKSFSEQGALEGNKAEEIVKKIEIDPTVMPPKKEEDGAIMKWKPKD